MDFTNELREASAEKAEVTTAMWVSGAFALVSADTSLKRVSRAAAMSVRMRA